MIENQQGKELTARQKDILNLLGKGLTNQEICRALDISANTVKVHLANIYKILEVTNRTEAVSIFSSDAPEEERTAAENVKLLFEKNDDVEKSDNGSFFYHTLVNNINQFELLDIQMCSRELAQKSSHFWVECSFSSGPHPNLFLTLHHRNVSEILWSYSLSFAPGENLNLEVSRVSITLVRKIEKASAQLFKRGKFVEPGWWYESCFYRESCVTRVKDEYHKAMGAVKKITAKESTPIYTSFVMANLLYTACLEHWILIEDCVGELKRLGAGVIRENFDSQYAMYINALVSILSCDNERAVHYLKMVLEKNPLNVGARKLLAQMYVLIGNEIAGFRELEIYQDVYPNSSQEPFALAMKALMYFLSRKFGECIELCKEILFIMPDTPLPRLILVSALGHTGQKEEAKKQSEIFWKFHRDFKLKNLDNLLNNIHADKYRLMMDGLALAGFKD